MKLLFIDNLLFEGDPQIPTFDLQPHLGLLSLVAVVRQAGHIAEIFDPKLAVVKGTLPWGNELYPAASECILSFEPDLIGFTALGCNFHVVMQIAAAVHFARPDLPLLLGGPHASILHREILERFDFITAIIRHEAEETLLPVLDALGSDRMSSIPGVSWRRPDGQIVCNSGAPKVEELDTLPVPAFEEYPVEEIGMESIRVEAGRGCPFSCTFCSTASFFGRSYRVKSADRLVAEMDQLAERYGFCDFKLNHDLFTVSRRKVADFCQAVAPRAYRWACSARVDCVDPELLADMQFAGCRNIYFGIETGSVRLQSSSRKRLDLSLVDLTLDVTGQLGIETTTSFIIGYPDETEVDRAATLNMAGNLHRRPKNTSQIHLLTPEPGTAMLEQYRPKLRFDERRSGFNLPRFADTDDALIAADPELFVTHYYYDGLVPHSRNIFDAALWTEISLLENPSFEFLLDCWDGSLARLLDQAYSWWVQTHGAAASPQPNDLIGFTTAMFGSSAPIVSRLRYRNACRSPDRSAQQNVPPGGRIAKMQLSPRASLLRDLHRNVIGNSAVPGPEDIDRASFVILRPRVSGRASAYEIDEVTADLLSVIGASDCDDLLTHVDAAGLAQLYALEIVEPVSIGATRHD